MRKLILALIILSHVYSCGSRKVDKAIITEKIDVDSKIEVQADVTEISNESLLEKLKLFELYFRASEINIDKKGNINVKDPVFHSKTTDSETKKDSENIIIDQSKTKSDTHLSTNTHQKKVAIDKKQYNFTSATYLITALILLIIVVCVGYILYKKWK